MQRLNEIRGWLLEKISRVGQRRVLLVLIKVAGHSTDLSFTVISDLLVLINTITEFHEGEAEI